MAARPRFSQFSVRQFLKPIERQALRASHQRAFAAEFAKPNRYVLLPALPGFLSSDLVHEQRLRQMGTAVEALKDMVRA